MPIYWAILTYVLLRPSNTEKEDLWIDFANMDKVVHISAFLVLGFCYLMAFPKQKFIVFIGIMLVYAFLTEVLQEVMALGRTMEMMDFLADIFGAILGYFIQKILKMKCKI